MTHRSTFQVGEPHVRPNRAASCLARSIQGPPTEISPPPAVILCDINAWRSGSARLDSVFAIELRARAILKSKTFLGSLPDAAFEAVVARMHFKKFAYGDIICRRQQCSETMMAVISGSLKIATSNVDGREIVLDFVGPGHISGEVAMLDGMERIADAIALDDAEVGLFHARDLLPVLTAHPETLLEMTRGVCRKLRAATALNEDHALDVRRRVARGLVGLAARHGRSGRDGVNLGLEISQAELSSYLGMSRENINRELRYLRGESMIANDRNRIVIIDVMSLRAVADACATQRARKPTPAAHPGARSVTRVA